MANYSLDTFVKVPINEIRCKNEQILIFNNKGTCTIRINPLLCTFKSSYNDVVIIDTTTKKFLLSIDFNDSDSASKAVAILNDIKIQMIGDFI